MELIFLAIIVFLHEYDKEGRQWRDKEYQEGRKRRASIYGDDRRTPKQFKERMRNKYGYIYDEWCMEYDRVENNDSDNGE